MHNTEATLGNKTLKVFLDFAIQTDPLITARRPGLAIVSKKKKKDSLPYSRICHFA